MMDYYSGFSGPSKSVALEQVKSQYKASLLEPLIEAGKEEDLERLLEESITEGVNEIYGDSDECPGSATGWAIFVKSDILKAIRRILGEKINKQKESCSN
jgi:hypothetical protein